MSFCKWAQFLGCHTVLSSGYSFVPLIERRPCAQALLMQRLKPRQKSKPSMQLRRQRQLRQRKPRQARRRRRHVAGPATAPQPSRPLRRHHRLSRAKWRRNAHSNLCNAGMAGAVWGSSRLPAAVMHVVWHRIALQAGILGIWGVPISRVLGEITALVVLATTSNRRCCSYFELATSTQAAKTC